LIVGGLGGLGRSAVLWMAGKGARNLILLSRSGPVTKVAIELLKKLMRLGVRVEAPKCDVSSSEEISRILLECSKELPPIKGCIQSAMVLKVRGL
jgi:NAD(P)-dependent dehydrogenase (short-subunit alcohol dehydrogenase family)